MNCRLLIAFLFLAGKLLAQTPQDSVIIRGQVTDFNGTPISGCTVMWQNPSFNSSVEVLTDNQGHYAARIPKGKYQSMAAVDLDVYPHTSNGVSNEDQRLEFWAWDFIADRDTTINIRYHRMEVYGLHAFYIPGGMPTYQIFVRPMSLTRFHKITEQGYMGAHGEDLSGIKQSTVTGSAKGIFTAPHPDQLNARVWIDGEEVTVLMKQEIKEYYSADEYGNAYLLTVDKPKCTTSLPYHIFKVELEDLEYGDRGEGLYYMEKESYVQ